MAEDNIDKVAAETGTTDTVAVLNTEAEVVATDAAQDTTVEAKHGLSHIEDEVVKYAKEVYQ